MRLAALITASGVSLALGAAALADPPPVADPLDCFFMGNSLTIAQVQSNDTFAEVLADAPSRITTHYHTHGGVSLTSNRNAWNCCGSTSGFSPSPFNVTFIQDHYDALIFQPFIDSSTTEAETIRILCSQAQASPDAKIYIYATWPGSVNQGQLDNWSILNFTRGWEATYTDATAPIGYRPSRAYYDDVLLRVRRALPGREVWMIPAGHVFAEVEKRSIAGEIDGMSTVRHLYFDAIHLWPRGQFVVASTMSAVLLGQDPRGIPVPERCAPGTTPQMITDLQRTVWDVLYREAPLTGRAFEGACGRADVAGPGQALGSDGELSADDLIVYINWFYQADARADVAGPGQTPRPDGEFSHDDLIVFLQRFFEWC